MDILIPFFRDTLDGWLYYVILVVNTILIFAIIGYLGDKKMALMLAQSKQYEDINRETLKGLENSKQEIESKEPQQNTIANLQTIPHIQQTTSDIEFKTEPDATLKLNQEVQEQVPTVLDLDDISRNSK